MNISYNAKTVTTSLGESMRLLVIEPDSSKHGKFTEALAKGDQLAQFCPNTTTARSIFARDFTITHVIIHDRAYEGRVEGPLKEEVVTRFIRWLRLEEERQTGIIVLSSMPTNPFLNENGCIVATEGSFLADPYRFLNQARA